ncbi:MAG TPA: aminotransferase class V-fold PLP-dependent enzyme [Gaiella sp.]|nr:aminotransferase class V-fold PLP-dependent enzyme [Gaiella sp.]
MTFAEARALFPVLDTVAYLNAGTFGPLARPVAEALVSGIRRDLTEGRVGKEYFEETLALREDMRSAFARLVGAEAEQVALTSSTTDGCGIVLRGLGLTERDEIVTTTDEHFGLLGPVGASPARVVVAPPEPERIAAAVTPRTRLIATSRVLWTTGEALPLRELREQCGIPVLADGAQSVGAIPDDVDGLDFLTISGQKWLCGPDSTGALVVRDPDRLAVVSPSYFAQRAHRPDGSFDPQPGARRFEPAWWSNGTVRAMLAALALRPDWWLERAREAAARCRELLAPRYELVAPDAESTLVSFRVENAAAAGLVARLSEQGVAVREIPGRGIVRVSCGWWTSDGDLDRLVAALDA